MIDAIHLDPKLEKCLETLRKASRRACLAADRVDAIITALETGDTDVAQVCAFTRYGESRIKGCRKFDLGAGYRLVTLKQDNDLFLLFAGTHDECTRWIDNNRDHLALNLRQVAGRSRIVRPGAKMEKEMVSIPVADWDVMAGEDAMMPIDDRDLRIIFSGLVERR